ncbi:hypothetical protein K438DRAFT_1979300 [Mycena galopus ATCC 62051]|nr:hypothetical protein K438DRAFT_1979300 [Mycena galopus ATCC 62051]
MFLAHFADVLIPGQPTRVYPGYVDAAFGGSSPRAAKFLSASSPSHSPSSCICTPRARRLRWSSSSLSSVVSPRPILIHRAGSTKRERWTTTNGLIFRVSVFVPHDGDGDQCPFYCHASSQGPGRVLRDGRGEFSNGYHSYGLYLTGVMQRRRLLPIARLEHSRRPEQFALASIYTTHEVLRDEEEWPRTGQRHALAPVVVPVRAPEQLYAYLAAIPLASMRPSALWKPH